MVVAVGFIVGCLLHLFTKQFTKNPSSVSDYAFFAFAAIFKNSNLDPKRLFCSRILVSAWLLFTFMLTEHYGAKLQSFLLLTHYRGVLFENMDQAMDAMEYHGWKMVFNESVYSPLLHCDRSQCTRLRKLHKRSLILEYNMSLEEAVEIDRHFGFSALPSVTAPHDWNILDHAKRILFVRDRMKSPVHISYIVRKKVPALKKLNEAIAYASAGYPTIHNRYMQPYDRYVIKHLRENVNVLTLSHISVLFTWTGRLLLFAIAYFFGEIVHFRYNRLLLHWLRRNLRRFGIYHVLAETQKNIELTLFSHFEQ